MTRTRRTNIHADKKDEIEKVLELIRNAMGSDIPRWEELFDLGGDAKTAVEVLTRGHDSENPRVLPMFREGRIRDRIFQRLGHIIISFQSPENLDALKSAYVFPSEVICPPHCVNDEKASLKGFLNDLISQAENARELFENGTFDMAAQMNAAAGSNWFWLHGKKGIGKTFFLNHFFATYRPDLENHQLMWIRMDLWRSFGDDKDLRHRVYSQATKIFFRYFHIDSVKRVNLDATHFTYDDEAEVKKKLEASAGYRDLFEEFDDLVKAIKGRFVDEEINRPVEPGDIPLGLGKEFFKRIQAKKFVPLLVFDGFDRLESTSEFHERFMALKQGMTELREDPAFLGAVILVVCRTATIEALKREGWGRLPGRVYSLPERHIRGVFLEDVIEQRLLVVKSEIEGKIRSKPNGVDWIGMLDGFKSYAVEKLEDEEEPACGALNRIHNTNTRAKMQSLQLLWYEFLKKNELEEEERGSTSSGLLSYKLVEALMISGRRYPPVHYKYDINDDGLPIRGLGNNLFDINLLPSLFCFPFARENTDEGERSWKVAFPKEMHGFLAGLRVLQLVRAHDHEINHSRKTGDLLRVRELVKLCKVLFGYEKRLIINLIEELGQFDLITLTGEHSPIKGC